MSIDARIRALNIEIPPQPRALAEMGRLLASATPRTTEIGAVIESDMALASAVLRVVNSSLFGFSGEVQTVMQAIAYLGTGEVSALTLQMSLRAAFPRTAELDMLWDRAAARSSCMAHLAVALGVDAWTAHAAGLFEECGKAILLRHAAERYRSLLAAADGDESLLLLEHGAFGLGHDALGAALCATWGLAPAAVHSVRHHVAAQARLALPADRAESAVCALSVLAHQLWVNPDRLEAVVHAVADATGWAPAALAAAMQQTRQQVPAAAQLA